MEIINEKVRLLEKRISDKDKEIEEIKRTIENITNNNESNKLFVNDEISLGTFNENSHKHSKVLNILQMNPQNKTYPCDICGKLL